MPLTFPSHAAAVWPLHRAAPRLLPAAALIVGSCTPDFAYLLGIDGLLSHSLRGTIIFSLPMGLLTLAWLDVIAPPMSAAVRWSAPVMRLAASLTPSGHVMLISPEPGEPALEGEAADRISAAWDEGPAHGLLHLGWTETGTPSPPAFSFFRDLAEAVVSAVCTTPAIETLRDKVQLGPARRAARAARRGSAADAGRRRHGARALLPAARRRPDGSHQRGRRASHSGEPELNADELSEIFGIELQKTKPKKKTTRKAQRKTKIPLSPRRGEGQGGQGEGPRAPRRRKKPTAMRLRSSASRASAPRAPRAPRG